MQNPHRKKYMYIFANCNVTMLSNNTLNIQYIYRVCKQDKKGNVFPWEVKTEASLIFAGNTSWHSE